MGKRRYPSSDFHSLDAIVTRYLEETGQETGSPCRRGAFGVAGPVQDGRCRTTNLPWEIDAAAMQQDLGLGEVRLLNDLEANAWGIPALGPEDFYLLQPGAPEARGNAAVIAAGTGLGEAGMYWDGERHHPFASEGGHTDFSPAATLEIALLRYLRRSFEHVSWERVVCGKGMVDILRFPAGVAPRRDPPTGCRGDRRGGDPAAVSRAAGRGSPCDLRRDDGFLRPPLWPGGREIMGLKLMALAGYTWEGESRQKSRPWRRALSAWLFRQGAHVAADAADARAGDPARGYPAPGLRPIHDGRVLRAGKARFSPFNQ